MGHNQINGPIQSNNFFLFAFTNLFCKVLNLFLCERVPAKICRHIELMCFAWFTGQYIQFFFINAIRNSNRE